MEKDILDNEKVMLELKGIESDSIIANFETERQKNVFSNSLLNSGLGEEIKNCNKIQNQVCKIKVPFRQKLKNIINRLKVILNNDGSE